MGYRSQPEIGGSSPARLLGGVLLLGLAIAVALLFMVSSGGQKVIDFAGGIMGLVLGIGGFAITLWQLSETRSAAEQASTAVERLRKDVRSLDIISELHVVTNGAAAAIDRLKEHNWDQASETYERIRVALNKVTVFHSRLDVPFDEAVAKDFLSHLIAAAGELESLPDGNEIDTTEMRARLRQLNDFAVAVEASIRDRIGEH